MKRKALILALGLGLFYALTPLQAKEREPGYWIEGPVDAQIIRVLDGDTVEVRAFPWPQQSVKVKVRLRGIDAPEIRTRCKAEKKRGEKARFELAKLLEANTDIHLTKISGGKYFGRVLANLKLENGGDASEILLQAGLVRPYEGGRGVKVACE